jgi:hypothetical protein
MKWHKLILNISEYQLFIVLFFIIFHSPKGVLAEFEQTISDSIEVPCHIEEFAKQQVSVGNKPPLEADDILILPYFIYADLYDLSYNAESQQLIKPKCQQTAGQSMEPSDSYWLYRMFRGHYEFATHIRQLIFTHALLAYNLKYGNTVMPEISQNEISIFEARANNGDLEAILKLKQYYEYPNNNYYNPEQTEARYWLFKAIEAEDEASMLEAGYERPYSVRTELNYEGTTIAVDVACEGIVRTGHSVLPACFLYNILIGENPGQVGHLVLDEDHLSGKSVRPQFLALKKYHNQVIVELISYSDNFGDRIRKDYFSLDGEYLGSDTPGDSADYFWNYRLRSLSPSNGFTQFSLDGSERVDILIDRVKIRILPYVESFLFWETEYPKRNVLQAMDRIFFRAEECTQVFSEDVEQATVNYENETLLYGRMMKYFNLDMFASLRLNTRDRASLTGIEEGYFAPDFRYNPCQNFLPTRAFVFPGSIITPNECNPAESFQAYEELKGRPTYVIELGSQVESIKMLQVCRYLGTFPQTKQNSLDDSPLYSPEFPIPCYALLLRAKTKGGFKYHFVINSINKVVTQHVSNNITRSTLYTKNDDDGNVYFVLLNELRRTHLDSRRNYCRVDIFDDQFQYLGSTDDARYSNSQALISMSMVPEYQPLPKIIIDKFNKSEGWSIFENPYLPNDLSYYYVYPECSDIIIEQHRRNS